MKKLITTITKSSLVALMAVGLTTFVTSTPVSAKNVKSSKLTGQYIVILKDTVDVNQIDNVALELQTKGKGQVKHAYKSALKGFSISLSAQNVDSLKSDSRVQAVVQDQEMHATGTVQTLPTGVNRIDAENKDNKGSGVNVAVIDTGINTSHPDLKSNIAGGKNCSNGTSYTDGNGHGTHVAGIIAALNNTKGVVGVAPQAKLWSVRVLDETGSGSWSSVICGIDFVTSKAPKNGGPIKVANMSLGGDGMSDNNCGKTNNDPIHQAICNSRDAGVTYIVAAGNSGVDASTFIPAAYDDAVITVSALGDSDGKSGGLGPVTSFSDDDTFAWFSNYGSVVDIAAPGVDILSTYIGGGYTTMSGTSMASPHVAGAAALYIKNHSSATWLEVREALKSQGESLGSGHTDPSGLRPEKVVRAKNL